MEITGRLTSDAEVKKVKGSREVVTFTVAVNDYYQPKDGERREFTEYITCSYWLNTKIADSLLQAAIVTVTGRIYLNEYEGKDGKHYANLAFHANNIKIIAKGGKKAAPVAEGAAATPETKDDLPF